MGVVSRLTGEHRFDVRPSKLGGWAAPVMGMAFAFAWTPCIGPVLGVVLGLASHNGTLAGGVLLLFAYSLGLALPFVLVGLGLRPHHGRAGPGPPRMWAVELVAGLLLVGFGVLLLTDNVGWLSNHVSTRVERHRAGSVDDELTGSGAAPMDDVVTKLTGRIRQFAFERQGTPAPVVVALDGRSGVGKSTLARASAEVLGALVIDGDDFYSGGTGAFWDAMDAEEKVEWVIDWRRQRQVLDSLRRGRRATWSPYDWEADDGRFGRPVSGGPAEVVILEGAYSARPELADLLDLRVLLEVPPEVRRARLLRREGARYRAEWEARWAEAEDLYFGTRMPRRAFDFVIADERGDDEHPHPPAAGRGHHSPDRRQGQQHVTSRVAAEVGRGPIPARQDFRCARPTPRRTSGRR